MEAILQNRDYVAQRDGGILCAEGNQALLCQALFRLCCRRGSFPFLPELGSRLWQLRSCTREKLIPLATAYASEALEPMGLRVQGVRLLSQDGERLRLDVQLSLSDQTEHLEVAL